MVGIIEVGGREVGIGTKVGIAHFGVAMQEAAESLLHVCLLQWEDGGAIGGAKGRGDEPQPGTMGTAVEGYAFQMGELTHGGREVGIAVAEGGRATLAKLFKTCRYTEFCNSTRLRRDPT